MVLLLTALAPAHRFAADAGNDAGLEGLLIEVAGNTYRFEVEIVDDEKERAQGLMFRRSLGENEGMLFLYPSPRPVTFWMKNTYLALDLVFIAQGGIVTRVAENTVPLSEASIPSVEPVVAVLEINAGMVRRLGISTGARIRHPAYFP